MKRKNRRMITITDKGKLALLTESIREKSHNEKWDGKWRLVIFDIIETARKERNFLRTYLKSFGLIELQKSVWIYPYDIEEEFKIFLKLCNKNFEGDIKFMRVETISDDKELRKIFKVRS